LKSPLYLVVDVFRWIFLINMEADIPNFGFVRIERMVVRSSPARAISFVTRHRGSLRDL
jgi:hypothetical protein